MTEQKTLNDGSGVERQADTFLRLAARCRNTPPSLWGRDGQVSNSFWGWMSEKNPNYTTWLRWRSVKAPSHLLDAAGSPETTTSAVCKEHQQFDRVVQTLPQPLQCQPNQLRFLQPSKTLSFRHTTATSWHFGGGETRGRKLFQLKPERDNHEWLQQQQSWGHGTPGHVQCVCGVPAAHSRVSGKRGTKWNSSRATAPRSQRMERDERPQHPTSASIFSI